MAEWIRVALDLILIVMVGAGLWQAARLIRHLAGLRQGRVDMERFVHEFNATVIRAETGIKGLRVAARESGDDLEKLVEKAHLVRDELHFLVDSGDKIAERLSRSAATAMRPEDRPVTRSVPPAARPVQSEPRAPAAAPVQQADAAKPSESSPSAAQPSSRAEKELLQALQKLN